VVTCQPTTSEHREWPERVPVLGPLVALALALAYLVTSIVQADGDAAMVFAVVTALLGAVAWRNARVCHGDVADAR
jgi:hypothetical protein